MKKSSVLAPERIASLEGSGLLDSPAEAQFDRLTELAAHLLKVPVALVSLVTRDRQFFKSQHGLPEPWASRRETPLSHSFCQHVASDGQPLVIEDARQHELVRDNLAVSDLGVVAYAGMPLTDPAGETLGAFCAIDTKPRKWTESELAVLQTLSLQVMTEIELRRSAVELRQKLAAQQAAELERFRMMRFTVHDLRTPLSALHLNLQALTLFGPLNADQQESAMIAARNVSELRAIVDGLLAIGEVDQTSQGDVLLAVCSVEILIRRMLEQTGSLAAAKAIALEVNLSKDTPAVQADAKQFLRVLVNVIANAIKFTQPGGRVKISTARGQRQGLPVVLFSVADNGPGISPEDTERIFTEGVHLPSALTTEHSYGLGLTYCRRVVQAHGGEIWLESELGRGSTFHIALPAR